MTTPTSPPVAELLDYLQAIGYEEIYLPPALAASAAAAQPCSDQGGAEELAVVAAEAAGCEACPLSRTRKSVVFGVGDPAADLMVIGEGPGADEDRQGVPFVGPAGQLLDRILGAIELRREDVDIANIVKCRPPGNRDPHPDEVTACRHFLERQIDLVRPRLLVALGLGLFLPFRGQTLIDFYALFYKIFISGMKNGTDRMKGNTTFLLLNRKIQ